MEACFTSPDTALVVVTHDRAFMEAVCTAVLELDAGEAHLYQFGGEGSYARFREVKSCSLPHNIIQSQLFCPFWQQAAVCY